MLLCPEFGGWSWFSYRYIYIFVHFIFHLSLSPHRHPEGSLSKSSGSFMFNSFSLWKSLKIYPNHHLPQQNSHISRPKSRVPLAFPGPFRASQARAKLGHGDQFKGTHVEGTAVDLAGPDPGTGGGFTTKTMVDFLGDSISRNGFPWFQYGDISTWGFHGDFWEFAIEHWHLVNLLRWLIVLRHGDFP